MVKDHSDSERGNPLPPHELRFPISSKGSLICITHIQDNTYHVRWYTSRGALAGTRNSSMGPPRRIDPTTNRTMSERSNLGATSRSSSGIDNHRYWLLWDCNYYLHPTREVSHIRACQCHVSHCVRNIDRFIHKQAGLMETCHT